jgi:hypothetical protein
MRIALTAGFVGLISPLVAFQQTASVAPSSNGLPPVRNPSPELTRAIRFSASYLERACRPTGAFVYKVDTDSSRILSSYNIVRHAGAIYALAMFNRSHPDRGAVDTMVRAATYLRTRYIGLDSRSNALAVWSRPLPAQSDADLGAAGLGLVALAEVHRVKPNAIRLDDLQSVGKFALSLQKPDGSFFSKYRADSGPVGDWQSLYYPGEAALGLISLYELDHSREWLVAAGKALSYLARSRANMRVLPPDHWAVIATAKFLPYDGIGVAPASRSELIAHASRIVSGFLPGQIASGDPALDGAFDPTGRTTPAATRLEGLLAALEFLPDDGTGLRQGIETAVQHGIAFLLRAQITSGPFVGGMPGVVRRTDSFVAKANPLASQVRIDYVQHALSAWLRYQTLLEKRTPNH